MRDFSLFGHRIALNSPRVLFSFLVGITGLVMLSLLPVFVAIKVPLRSLSIGDREVFALSGADTVAGGHFVSTSDSGLTVEIESRFLVPGFPGAAAIEARDINVTLTPPKGQIVKVKSDFADIDADHRSMIMHGNTELEVSSGLRLVANSLIVAADQGRISSPGEVLFETQGLLGIAGRMTLLVDSILEEDRRIKGQEFDDSVYLVFNRNN